jgi:hypothetical protein
VKINKTQKAALWQIHRCGGAVMTSHWTNGIGRYTRSRAVPPFCKRIERYRAEDYPKRIMNRTGTLRREKRLSQLLGNWCRSRITIRLTRF